MPKQKPTQDQLKAFWAMADTSGDGKLDIHEFKAVCVANKGKSGSLNDRQIADLFQSMNDNGDKFLSYEEYEKHVMAEECNRENLEAAFRQFDKDGDGTISKNELRKIMLAKGFKMESVDVCFDKADKDGDGNISFNEFMTAMY